MNENIQNPGSALGEAIGAEMENALNIFLAEVVGNYGYKFVSKGVGTTKLGTPKKLLMFDKWGTAYNIDAVITTESMQPVILFESKYIRYKKHNRDKGSWVCTVHSALRRRYPSIRSSIAVLAGNWSSSSVTMMKSHDINVFLIPFQRISDLLAEHGIDFNWGEKDRVTANTSWKQYNKLSLEERSRIGTEIISLIKPELEALIVTILDNDAERLVERITIELHSNLGEVVVHEFENVEQAIEFLNTSELKTAFLVRDSPTLLDPAPFPSNDEYFDT